MGCSIFTWAVPLPLRLYRDQMCYSINKWDVALSSLSYGMWHYHTGCTITIWAVTLPHGLYHYHMGCTITIWSVASSFGLYHYHMVCSIIVWAVPLPYGLYHHRMVCTFTIWSVPYQMVCIIIESPRESVLPCSLKIMH